MVVVSTIVQSTMGQGTSQSNQGSRQNGGDWSKRNRMSKLGLVI